MVAFAAEPPEVVVSVSAPFMALTITGKLSTCPVVVKETVFESFGCPASAKEAICKSSQLPVQDTVLSASPVMARKAVCKLSTWLVVVEAIVKPLLGQFRLLLPGGPRLCPGGLLFHLLHPGGP